MSVTITARRRFVLITRRQVLAALAVTGVCKGGQFQIPERRSRFGDDASGVQLVALSQREDDMVIQLIHFTFATADAERAQMMLRELRDTSRKEVGVVGFDVARSQETPNTFVLWEQYRDKAAQDAHVATEHFKRLVVNGVRMLAKERNAEILDPV